MSFGTHRPMESTKPSFHERFVNGSSAGLHVFRDQRSLTPGRRHARAVAPSSLVAIAAFACILVLQAKAVVISCSRCPKDCGKKDCQCAGGLSLGDIQLTLQPMTQQQKKTVEEKLKKISLPKDLDEIGPIPNDLIPLYEEKKQLMARVGKTYEVISGPYQNAKIGKKVTITKWQPWNVGNVAGKLADGVRKGYHFYEAGKTTYGYPSLVVDEFPEVDKENVYMCKDQESKNTFALVEEIPQQPVEPSNTSSDIAGMNGVAAQEAGQSMMEESKNPGQKITVAKDPEENLLAEEGGIFDFSKDF